MMLSTWTPGPGGTDHRRRLNRIRIEYSSVGFSAGTGEVDFVRLKHNITTASHGGVRRLSPYSPQSPSLCFPAKECPGVRRSRLARKPGKKPLSKRKLAPANLPPARQTRECWLLLTEEVHCFTISTPARHWPQLPSKKCPIIEPKQCEFLPTVVVLRWATTKARSA